MVEGTSFNYSIPKYAKQARADAFEHCTGLLLGMAPFLSTPIHEGETRVLIYAMTFATWAKPDQWRIRLTDVGYSLQRPSRFTENALRRWIRRKDGIAVLGCDHMYDEKGDVTDSS